MAAVAKGPAGAACRAPDRRRDLDQIRNGLPVRHIQQNPRDHPGRRGQHVTERDPMTQRLADPVVARIAGALASRLDEMTDTLAQRIVAEIDLYRSDDVVSRAELARSVRQNLSMILGQLSLAHPADLSAPRETGRICAELGAPLAEVLRAYGIGFAFLWESLLGQARQTGKESLDALLDTATVVWALADDYSRALTDAYRSTVAWQLVAADRRRSALVTALTHGPVGDAGTAWEVAHQLGMPYRGTFVVVLAENAGIGSEGMSGIEDRLNTLGIGSAWRLQPDFEVGVLSYGRRRSSAEVLDVLRSSSQSRVGVSAEFSELEHTPRAMRFARVALDSLPDGRPGVRQFDDNPLAELVMGSREVTRRVVRRVLGGVLALAAEERTPLLDTATAWLDAHGSVKEAGRVLYCHENTVRYRLHRLEQYLGQALDDPKAIAELAAALTAIRTFPELVEPESAIARGLSGASSSSAARCRAGAGVPCHRCRRPGN
jgi:hypothetical protein